MSSQCVCVCATQTATARVVTTSTNKQQQQQGTFGRLEALHERHEAGVTQRRRVALLQQTPDVAVAVVIGQQATGQLVGERQRSLLEVTARDAQRVRQQLNLLLVETRVDGEPTVERSY